MYIPFKKENFKLFYKYLHVHNMNKKFISRCALKTSKKKKTFIHLHAFCAFLQASKRKKGNHLYASVLNVQKISEQRLFICIVFL